MANTVPPFPIDRPVGSFEYADWFTKIREVLNNVTTITWNNIDFTGSDLADIVTRPHNGLQSLQGGTSGEYYHLTAAQHTDLTDGNDSAAHYHSTDRSRSNHTGTQTMSTISDLPTLASGSYTPTLTPIANYDGSTTGTAHYIRVGDRVTVSGKFSVNATTAGVTTQMAVTLPVASNFSSSEDLAGVVASSQSTADSGGVFADTTNDRATIQWVATATGDINMYYTFSYRII